MLIIIFLGLCMAVLGFASLYASRYRPGKVVDIKPSDYKQISFLSVAEIEFLKFLDSFVAGRARIFSKVRIADVLTPVMSWGSSRWYLAFNRISAKHLDFVLVDKNYKVIAVIELDDSSHSRPDRKSRDSFVDSIFASVSLPVFHVPVRRNYLSDDLISLDMVLKRF